MVGPFIFFDQMGPVQLMAGRGMDVRPHPHIGLATVTYLFDGSVMHRDSEGNALEITPGSMNLMTAGRGISHSERTPPSVRTSGGGMFGIQSWIALPQEHEEMAPLFEHFDAASLPTIADNGIRARVIAGSAFGQKSPVGMVSEWFYAEVLLDRRRFRPARRRPRGARDLRHRRRGRHRRRQIRSAAPPRLPPRRPHHRKATKPSRLMFLGGAALEGPRYLWWNFVSSRQERIEEAKEEWKSGRFALIPGDEKEFIPLPEK